MQSLSYTAHVQEQSAEEKNRMRETKRQQQMV